MDGAKFHIHYRKEYTCVMNLMSVYSTLDRVGERKSRSYIFCKWRKYSEIVEV